MSPACANPAVDAGRNQDEMPVLTTSPAVTRSQKALDDLEARILEVRYEDTWGQSLEILPGTAHAVAVAFQAGLIPAWKEGDPYQDGIFHALCSVRTTPGITLNGRIAGAIVDAMRDGLVPRPGSPTTGPWIAEEDRGERTLTIRAEGKSLARVYAADTAAGQANARLMAQAPDLLAVLQDVQEQAFPLKGSAGVMGLPRSAWERIQAQIDQATGKRS